MVGSRAPPQERDGGVVATRRTLSNGLAYLNAPLDHPLRQKPCALLGRDAMPQPPHRASASLSHPDALPPPSVESAAAGRAASAAGASSAARSSASFFSQGSHPPEIPGRLGTQRTSSAATHHVVFTGSPQKLCGRSVPLLPPSAAGIASIPPSSSMGGGRGEGARPLHRCARRKRRRKT